MVVLKRQHVWLAALLLWVAPYSLGQPKPEVLIGAAANLTDTFRQIGPRFEAVSGIHPVFSFASTAQLTQQIANGAPFDVFVAADTEHVEEVDGKGLLLPGSRAVYAIGVLVLWNPPLATGPVHDLQDLLSPQVRTIAVAKPELAPYGKATVSVLQRAGLWNRVKDKIVFAENINMARQFGLSGNADAVFVAYSLVLHAPGNIEKIDPSLYPPIEQSLAIVSTAEHKQEAKAFIDFLLQGEGKKLLKQSGYELPQP